MSRIFFTVPDKPKSWTELARTFGFLTFLSQNVKKIERGPFEVIENFLKKSLTMPKTERRDPLGIFDILSQNIKN